MQEPKLKDELLEPTHVVGEYMGLHVKFHAIDYLITRIVYSISFKMIVSWHIICCAAGLDYLVLMIDDVELKGLQRGSSFKSGVDSEKPICFFDFMPRIVLLMLFLQCNMCSGNY